MFESFRSISSMTTTTTTEKPITDTTGYILISGSAFMIMVIIIIYFGFNKISRVFQTKKTDNVKNVPSSQVTSNSALVIIPCHTRRSTTNSVVPTTHNQRRLKLTILEIPEYDHPPSYDEALNKSLSKERTEIIIIGSLPPEFSKTIDEPPAYPGIT